MAKEMMIVFMYDTEHCQDEADDPVDAVLYFHPSWVSDTQKLSLCGQLMGTAHFLKETFARPKSIGLQSGKFILKEFGRFLLAIGTDRNIAQSVLEHRADLLESFIKFFHKDIQTIYDQFSVNGQYKNLKEKLYHIFETYLPILQHNGNIFQTMPISRLPKSASSIFLESMQTLQSCQQTKGILGGVILYHNKVISTQLCPKLTTNLVLTDPYRIKTTAEIIPVDFHVPFGCTLIAVYIPLKEYRKLSADATRAQTAFSQASASIVPFQFKRKMKRDKSIIFSHIPEEGVPEVEFRQVLNRPTHLPLRLKNIASKDLPESGFGSINFDENDSYPEFIGKTSVCSTPMTENKVLHAAVLSICVNPEDNQPAKPDTTNTKFPDIDITKSVTNFLSNSLKNSQETRRNSMNDLNKAINRFSKHFSLKSFGLQSLGPRSDIVDGCYDEEDEMIDDNERTIYSTITDPYYPVFNSEGAPISKCLFQEIFEAKVTEVGADPVNDAELEVAAIAIEAKEDDNLSAGDNIIPIENIKEKVEVHTPSTSNRRALSLPLKSLTHDNMDGLGNVQDKPSGSNMFDSPARRKKLNGIQLTPLMSKLTILAMDEDRSGGFSNWDTTPACETPCEPRMTKRTSSLKPEDIVEVGDDVLQKVELFVCGQQNMTLMLVLEDGSAQKKELVQSMFETCVSRLSKIETNLNQSFNINIDSAKNDGQYSFISLDPNWGTLQRGGPWAPSDLHLVEAIRHDFEVNEDMTDLVLRTQESVLYGSQYGKSNVFYKQTAQPQVGIPPPADVMGTCPLYAKRRLERDHSIILL